MLTSLKETFSKPAAAIALGGITMLSPMTAQADDAVFTSSSTTPIETMVERLELTAQAHDYAVLNPGHIGVSVLKGIDAPATGSEMATALERGVEKLSGRQAEGFHGDNGDKATEVSFFVPYTAPDGKFDVSTYGPYNFGDAVKLIQNWQTQMAPSYTPASLD